jgi:hypothetical protein
MKPLGHKWILKSINLLGVNLTLANARPIYTV